MGIWISIGTGGSEDDMSRNFTIHAAKDGVVTFVKTKKTHFSGKSLPRVRVEVR